VKTKIESKNMDQDKLGDVMSFEDDNNGEEENGDGVMFADDGNGQMNDEGNVEGYTNHWGSSVEGGEGEEDDEEEEIPFVDDLPVFADDTSKQLHQETKNLEKRRDEADIETRENGERVAIMTEHLKNVHQEVDYTNSLVASKNNEIQGEEHLQALAAREKGRYQQEIKGMGSTKLTEQEQLNLVQNSIFKANEEMDSFKLKMNWNQEELEQWALAARQKEEDNMALQKYTRADEVRIKDLTLQIENLTKLAVEKQSALENEATETQSRQIELDRTAEAFKILHTERQNLVKQWQEAIDVMRRRDVEINEIAEKFAEAKKIREAKFEVLEENRERLKMQETDNKEVEARIEQSERIVQAKRSEQMNIQGTQQKFKDELEVIKNELAASASSLLKKRQENVVSENELVETKEVLEKVRNRYLSTKEKVDKERVKTQKGEDLAISAEQAIVEREKDLKTAEKQVTALKQQMFRASQALFDLRQEEANHINEISGSQAASKTMLVRLSAFDTESMRQKELIYNAEFQIQQMERKVARGLGVRSDEEKRKLNAQIAELEVALNEKVEKRKMLTQQCRKVNNEYRAAVRTKKQCEEGKKELQGKIAETALENSSCEQTVKELVVVKEEVMVQNDIMRLDVKRLRDALNGKADQVFSLENRKQQLQLSMEERKQEISVHEEVRAAQLRAAEEEKHKNSVELGQRRSAVQKLKSKYETTVDSSADAEHSQAYYVIMAAQRREELQRQGDELDQDIRRREKEMKALEHTLNHLNVRNTEFRLSFHKADMNSADAEELRLLQEQSKISQDTLFRRKKDLQRLQTDYEEDMRRLEQVEQQTQRFEEQNQHLVNADNQVNVEINLQKESFEKAEAKIEKMSKKHRELWMQTAGEEDYEPSDDTLQEKAFKSEELEEAAGTILKTLSELSREFPEIYDTLKTALTKHGLTGALGGGGGGPGESVQ